MNRVSSHLRAVSWSGLVYWLPLLFFAGRINDFIYPRGSDFSDLTISHLPNLLYLREALLEYRTIPLWSPAILGGFPFFANPLSGIWYPPNWPAAVWPEPWIFNLLAGFHLVFGAYGMGRFLKASGLRREAQLFGGLAFGMMPKLLSHYAAGHITLVYAVVWTPWLLLAEIRPLRGWVRPGVLLAVIFLADPRWAAYAGVLWLAWSFSRKQRFNAWIRITGIETAAAVLLAGPLLVPLLEYTRLSTRAALTSAETLAFSLPPVNLIGLLFSTPNAEWQLYPGIVALICAAGAAIEPPGRKRVGFWILAAAAALLFAMGDSIPLIQVWASMPIAGYLRVPSRALFVFGIALVVVAAYALDLLFSESVSPKGRFRWNLIIVGLGMIYFVIVVAQGITQDPGQWALLDLIIVVTVWFAVNRRLPLHMTLPILLIWVFLDQSIATVVFSARSTGSEVIAEGMPAAVWLADRPGRFRVYSPSYSIPQHTAARYGLELASGVDPLQLEAYADFMGEASGVPNSGYSIPLPQIDGDVATANRDAVPDPFLLALLNVQFLAAEFELRVEGLELQEQFGETRIYENTLPPGMVWEITPAGDAQPVEPVEISWSPNRIDLLLDRPGVYFISEVDYPGWRVEGATPLPPYAGVFRTFEVESAEAQISYVFRPVSLYAGIVCFIIGMVIAILRYQKGDRRS